MKKITIIAAAAILAAGAGAAAAQPFGHGRPMEAPMHGGHNPAESGPMGELSGVHRMLAALDLTEEQREEIRNIVDEARSEVRSIMDRTRARDIRQEFLETFTDPDMTEADLDALFTEMRQTRESVREVIIGAIADIHDVLTEEQLQRILELAESRGHLGGPGPRF